MRPSGENAGRSDRKDHPSGSQGPEVDGDRVAQRCENEHRSARDRDRARAQAVTENPYWQCREQE